ncbi:MAG TPA: ABC transporter ATP-binding protein [Candidatus Limnocylindrales bacterium]|nr:ABC transporter ATP-binding protein [Candidatus Limnocylindrales bacterium]
MASCIEAQCVTKSYGKTVALDDVSFSIPCGERYALLGPNGAGKSTTLRLLVGLLKPDTGTIKIDGHEPFSPEAKSTLGYLPEDATPYRTLSVRENLEYIAALRGVKNVADATNRFLDELSLREYERAKVGKLSRGNMQKLSIALALVHDPKIVLLDEPLNYLDIPTQERVFKMLKSLDSTQIVSTHIMSIATRLTNKVLMIARGKIVWNGTIDALKAMEVGDESIESVVARLMTSAS